ncbi:hypothetical protein N7486_000200 [Penicillium sp. IBT 16267x]|nr:hypothetical protein N7486_000200 [Penicillium sp. IBT 16267x]
MATARQQWIDEDGNPRQVPLPSKRRSQIYALPVVRDIVWRENVEPGFNTPNRALIGQKQRVGVEAPPGQEYRYPTDTKPPPPFVQQEIDRQMASQQAPQQAPEQNPQQPQLQAQPQPEELLFSVLPYDGRYYTSPFNDPMFLQAEDLSLHRRALAMCNPIVQRLQWDKSCLVRHLLEKGEPEVKDGEDASNDWFAPRIYVTVPNPLHGPAYYALWFTSPWDDEEVCVEFNFPAHRRALRACNALIQRVQEDEIVLRLWLEEVEKEEI